MHKLLLPILVLITASSFAQQGQRPTTLANPAIVATVALTSQTANIPKTALYTPAADGVFRISAYMTMVVPGSAGQWWLTAYWGDDAGAQKTVIYQLNSKNTSPNASCNTVSGTACTSSVFIIDGKAGIPISYGIGAHAGAAGTYDVFVVVEQLI